MIQKTEVYTPQPIPEEVEYVGDGKYKITLESPEGKKVFYIDSQRSINRLERILDKMLLYEDE